MVQPEGTKASDTLVLVRLECPMSDIALHMAGAKALTVGDLIAELCRWPDHATLKFTCPVTGAEFTVAGIHGSSPGIVDIALQSVAEGAPVVPA